MLLATKIEYIYFFRLYFVYVHTHTHSQRETSVTLWVRPKCVCKCGMTTSFSNRNHIQIYTFSNFRSFALKNLFRFVRVYAHSKRFYSINRNFVNFFFSFLLINCSDPIYPVSEFQLVDIRVNLFWRLH